MNFVGNDGESEPWKIFWIFVYLRTASDSLIYNFGYYVFYWEEFMETTWLGEEFCGKNLLINYSSVM